MESEWAAPAYLEKMKSTVTGTYRSVIGMVLYEYKLGSSLNVVATHLCCPDTRSEITKVKYETVKN